MSPRKAAKFKAKLDRPLVLHDQVPSKIVDIQGWFYLSTTDIEESFVLLEITPKAAYNI